jgi:LuxR family transcriptional regulator, maltose regulon positive regulatory protein
LGDLDRALAHVPARAEPPIYVELRVQAALLRSYLARRQGAHSVAMAAAQEALALAPEANTMLRGLAAITHSHILLDAGDVAQAAAGYRQELAAIWAAGIRVIIPGVTNYLVQVLLLQGQLAAAETLCRETLRRIAAAGWEAAPQTGAAHIALAEVLCEQDQLDAAEDYARRGLEQSRRGAFFDEIRIGAICLARVRLARGEPADVHDSSKATALA